MYAAIINVLSAQFGGEGNGKIADMLCENADICAGSCDGINAGHTVVWKDVK
jgi:adenylosuccinate synthase